MYEQSSGWFKGQLRKNGSKGTGKKGIFPANYIEIWHTASKPSTSLKSMQIKEDEVLDTSEADEKGASSLSGNTADQDSEESLIQESAKMASNWNKELREHLKNGVSRTGERKRGERERERKTEERRAKERGREGESKVKRERET